MGPEEELGLVKNIFIINKQGCKGAGEAAEILMDRKTQASWLPVPTLMASISASGRTSWAHSGPLEASLPRADAGCPTPARCVWVMSVKCIVFHCRRGSCKGIGGGHAIWVREGSALLIPDLSPPLPPANLSGL